MPERFGARSAALAITASAVIAAFGFFLLPLWVEDTTVLFHRANYTDLPIPFYYQGYISFPAQLVSTLVAPFPAYLQAAAYAVAGWLIWSLMMVMVFKVAPITFIPFVGLAYFFTFDLLYVFNLTYSLWPSLVFIGLLGVLCQIAQRPVRWWEAALVVFLTLSSPLSLVMSVTFLPVVWAHRKSVPSWIALGACLASYPLLTEPGAGASAGIFGQIFARLLEIATDPGIVFSITGERLPISPPRLLRSGSLLLCIGFVALSILPMVRRRYGALLPFVAAALVIFLISLSRGSGETIATRYMFPVIFAAFVIASHVLRDMFPSLLSNTLRLTTYAGILGAGITLSLVEQPDITRSLQEFQKLRSAQSDSDMPPVFLKRPGPFNENDWTLAIGQFSFSQEDCRPDGLETAFRFQIHCGPGEILVQ